MKFANILGHNQVRIVGNMTKSLKQMLWRKLKNFIGRWCQRLNLLIMNSHYGLQDLWCVKWRASNWTGQNLVPTCINSNCKFKRWKDATIKQALTSTIDFFMLESTLLPPQPPWSHVLNLYSPLSNEPSSTAQGQTNLCKVYLCEAKMSKRKTWHPRATSVPS
jgi:hypothetical protein